MCEDENYALAERNAISEMKLSGVDRYFLLRRVVSSTGQLALASVGKVITDGDLN